jgi:hypothetical protein
MGSETLSLGPTRIPNKDSRKNGQLKFIALILTDQDKKMRQDSRGEDPSAVWGFDSIEMQVAITGVDSINIISSTPCIDLLGHIERSTWAHPHHATELHIFYAKTRFPRHPRLAVHITSPPSAAIR